MCNIFWCYARLFVRGTALWCGPSSARYSRSDLGRIPSGRMRYLMSSASRQADCCLRPVQVCDRPLCQGRITQFLVGIHLDGTTRVGDIWSVAPVAYQVMFEPGTGQFREFEPRRVHTRINSLGLFLVHNLTCGKRESVS